MADLDIDICRRFKTARKEKGISQSLLASRVGCKQSALSAFENGDSTKISDATVSKLAESLGVSLEKTEDGKEADISPTIKLPGMEVRGYCPDAACPSNVPYMVGDRLLFRPLRRICAPSGGSRCACCGEVLEMRCPTCGALLNDGACCGVCGSPYVTAGFASGVDVAAWVASRRSELFQLLNIERDY